MEKGPIQKELELYCSNIKSLCRYCRDFWSWEAPSKNVPNETRRADLCFPLSVNQSLDADCPQGGLIFLLKTFLESTSALSNKLSRVARAITGDRDLKPAEAKVSKIPSQ
jgi:hypothetical protein